MKLATCFIVVGVLTVERGPNRSKELALVAALAATAAAGRVLFAFIPNVQPVTMVVARGAERRTLHVVPVYDRQAKRMRVGFAFGAGHRHVGPLHAVALSGSSLWDLSKAYSGFFENCPVLKAATPELRQSRLLLCDLTARVIQRGLNLLGIRTVERM